VGHAKNFQGNFDYFMAFFFYLPNLLVVEILITAKAKKVSGVTKVVISIGLLFTTLFLLVGTYFFTVYYWGPAIINWIMA